MMRALTVFSAGEAYANLTPRQRTWLYRALVAGAVVAFVGGTYCLGQAVGTAVREWT